MPKLLKTQIAQWIKTRFHDNENACKIFNISLPTLMSWKKNPPKILIEYAKIYEENLKNKEIISDLQNDLHFYRMKLGYIITKEEENGINRNK